MVGNAIQKNKLKAGACSHLAGRYIRDCRATTELSLPLTTAQSRLHGAQLYTEPYRSTQCESAQSYDHSSYLLPYVGPQLSMHW